MLLKSLKLSNIRSYNDSSINFSEGSTLLIGDIGCGKTTILLAIEFALFGIIKGDVSGQSLLRHGKKEGSVELNFELNSQDITIIRRLKFSKDAVTQDSGKIIINGSSQDLTPVELKSKILELFGYPEDLLNKNTSIIYRYTVYTPQEDMKKILFESKEDRLDTLRKIFNIDKYKRIRENALTYSKELRNTKKNMESKISDLENIKILLEKNKMIKIELLSQSGKETEQNKILKEQLGKSSEELKSFEDKISRLNILKKDFEISSINVKNKQSDLDRNNKELGMIDYRINEYNSKLSELGIVDADENTISLQLSDAEDKLSKIKNAKEIIGKRLEDKQRDLKNMEIEDVASLKYKYEYLSKKFESKESKEKELAEIKDQAERNLIELNIINVNKINSAKIVNQLKDLSTCPTCLQNVDFSHKVKILDKENSNIHSCERKFAELQNRKMEYNSKLLELKSSLEDLQKSEIELNIIKTKLANIEKLQESKSSIEREIQELKVKKEKLDGMDINILLDRISKSRKLLNGLEAKKHIEESLAEKKAKKLELQLAIESTSKDLEELKNTHNIISDKIKSFEDIEKEYLEKKNLHDEINKSLTSSIIKLSSINKDIESAEKEISRLAEEIESKNKIKEKIIYVSELNYWMNEHIVNLASTIEKTVMQKIHSEFNALFQKWFNMLIDDENMNVRIDEEFTPLIIQDGYDTELSSLSGGEKTSVALAYRLALNKVINDLINSINTRDILILDEPTDGFSSEQLDKMRNVLYELQLRQLIMVSHEAKMESYVNNIIRINKNEHISQIIG
ncbi:MAG TPA: SMC family ATPase [Alphaproteobacteria bacterium]|nr:SMC family ATPase [Alphaproteobacteria bacterium]